MRVIVFILVCFKNQLKGFQRSLKLFHNQRCLKLFQNNVGGDFQNRSTNGGNVEVSFIVFGACREWWKLSCGIMNFWLEDGIDFVEDKVIEISGIVGWAVNWNGD